MARRLVTFGVSIAAILCVGIAKSASAAGDALYAVGFRYVYELDPDRAWEPSAFGDDEVAPRSDRRPVRVAMWYPAAADGEPMPVREYVAPSAPDPYFERLNQVMAAYDLWSYRGMFGGDSIQVERLLAMDSGVRYDATPAEGKFPVVVYSSGWYSRSPDNTAWAEYLAGRGYVVVTVPQLGPGVIEYDFKATPDRVRTQAQDLAFALDVVGREDFADTDRVAAAGYSIGGIAALWLQQDTPSIEVVIGLDGSFVFEDWIELTRTGVTTDRHPAAILAFHRGHDRQIENVTHEFIKSLSGADRYVASVNLATHGEFSDEPVLFKDLNAPWMRTEFNSLEQALTAHYDVIEATCLFLDAFLSGGDGSSTSRAELSAWPTSLQVTRYPPDTRR